MRDLLVLLLTIGCASLGLLRPWIGVLGLALFAYLNPHTYAWGFSRSLPVYLVIFSATMAGAVFNCQERRSFPWTRETKLFLLLLCWFTVTTLAHPEFPGPAKEQWVKVMKVYLGIFPTFWLINSRQKLRWLVIVISLSFGLIGLKGGIFAVGTGFHYRVWGPPNTFYGGNNEIAMALCMTLPLLLLCAKEIDSKHVKLFFYTVFTFSVCSIVSSWSRGGLLALSAVLLALVLLGRRKWLSVPILAFAVMFAIPNMPAEWTNRMHTIETYDSDASAMSRITVWQTSIEKALASPVTGGGFQAFREALTGPHSAYFGILGEHGFFALSLWLSLLFGTMIALERLGRRAQLHEGTAWIKDYARAIQIALLGYSVGGAFLEVDYWDYFYHLVALCALLKVFLAEAQATAECEMARAEDFASGLPLRPQEF